jgi:hypothetical protein
MVKNTILVPGEVRRISWAVLAPSITGIFMSRRTMSGFNSMTFKHQHGHQESGTAESVLSKLSPYFLSPRV